MRPTIRFGRIAGIEVGAHWSLLVVGTLLVTVLADTFGDLQPDAGGSYWAAAILAVALFFGSVLAHELAHSLVAIRRGQRVQGITLWLFGGVARLKDEARDARSELLVALAGPATSLALGGAFIGLAFALDAVLDDGSLLPTVAAYLGVINIVLAVFNLLPGAPLDGGRVLSAVMWMWRKDRRRGQIIAARAGRVVGYGLIALGVFAFFVDEDSSNLWTVLIGWFVVGASRTEEQQARLQIALDGRVVDDVMSPRPPAVHEWATAAELPGLLGGDVPHHVVLTDFGGTPRALLERALLRGVASDTRLRDRAIPIAQLAAVPRGTPLRAAIARGIPVVVLDDGAVVGVVGFEEADHLVRAAGAPAERSPTA